MLYLFGASGHAKVIIEIAEALSMKVGGLVDNNPAIRNLLGYPVANEIRKEYAENAEFIISIGNNAIRKRIAAEYQLNYISLAHPSSSVSARSEIADGSVVMAGVVVNSEAKVGKHCILNTNCSIDHDCILGDYVHISPNAALAGDVTIGEGTHVGIGACIIQGVKVGKWCTIGAGAVVIRDVPDYATVVGNPARIIKINSPAK